MSSSSPSMSITLSNYHQYHTTVNVAPPPLPHHYMPALQMPTRRTVCSANTLSAHAHTQVSSGLTLTIPAAINTRCTVTGGGGEPAARTPSPRSLACTPPPPIDACEHSISGEQLAARLVQNAVHRIDDRPTTVVLDYRNSDAYARAHIAGAVHAALPQLLYKRLVHDKVNPLMTIAQIDDTPAAVYRAWLQQHASDITLVLLTDTTAQSPLDTVTMRVDNVTSLLVSAFERMHFQTLLLTGGFDAFHCAYPHLCTTTVASDGGSLTAHQCSTNIVHPTDLPHIEHLSLADECQQREQNNKNCVTTDMRAHCQQHVQTACTLQACSSNQLPPPSQSNAQSPSCGSASKKFHPYHRASTATSTPTRKSNGFNCPFPARILPYLYLGNAQNSQDRQTLDRYGIRYIINVTKDIPNTFEKDATFKYLQIGINDHSTQNVAAHFAECCAFIDEARRREAVVLVHCVAGISRSVTVTVAYCMYSMHLSLEDAFDFVRLHKPNIAPNFNFMSQLLEWERHLRADTAGVTGSPDSGAFSSSGDEAVVLADSIEVQTLLNEDNLPVLQLDRPPSGRRRAMKTVSSPTQITLNDTLTDSHTP